MNKLPAQNEMEHAFLQGDGSYDGIFYTAVRTTGIFCRPSCSARKPLISNISFYSTAREALFAGYRPCLRCQPLKSVGKQPDWVQHLIETVEKNPQERLRDSTIRAMGIEPERAR